MRLPRGGRPIAVLAVATALAAAVVGLAGHLELHPDATNRLRDDAFYEFAWAANVAAGRGPMVSDGVTTSGVQLLWSLLLVPVAALVGAAALPLVAAWLGFALHVATAWMWSLGTRDRVAGVCLGLCWLGNPLLLRESQNGQETALAGLCLVGLWLARRRRTAVFAVWALLAVLARSELWLFVLVLSLWRDGWRAARAWSLPLPLLLLAVQLVANRLLGGGWLPDSAQPMAWLWHANHELAAGAGDGRAWLANQWWFTRPVLLGGPWAMASAMGLGFAVFTVLRGALPAALRAVPALLVGCASALGVHDLATAGWVALLLALFPARRLRSPPRGRLLLLAAATALLALHWAVRWYPRDYYAVPLVLVATAALQATGRWRVLLVLFAAAQIQGHGRVSPEPLRAQEEMQMAGRFLADVMPGDCGVGSFNSGLVTFYAAVVVDAPERRRRVFNLDGVVDSRAFAALRERRLAAFLDEHDVDFLVDNAVQFALDPRLPHACGHWFGGGFDPARDLVELARFDVPGVGQQRPGSDSMRLYWRRGRDGEPARPASPRDFGAAPDGGRYVLWPARAGEVLEAEGADGARAAVATVDVDTAAIVRVPRNQLGTGRLFVRGREAPLLTLSKL